MHIAHWNNTLIFKLGLDMFRWWTEQSCQSNYFRTKDHDPKAWKYTYTQAHSNVNDAALADQTLSVLMGDAVAPRKNFISSQAESLAVEDLDLWRQILMARTDVILYVETFGTNIQIENLAGGIFHFYSLFL